MNSQVTLKDVANAVGLSETTVSLVVNGKAARRGITPATQARVTAAIRQLGYQPDLVNRTIALHQAVPRAAAQPDGISNGRFQIAETEPIGRQIGLVLSTTSQTNTVALIPGVEQTFTEAGYRLNIAVTPADPASARERIGQLLREGPAGILACPSVYAVATAIVAETRPELDRRVCPVIVLWQDAAKAMIRAVSSGQLSVGSKSKATFSEPITPSMPAVQPPAAVTPAPTPEPEPVAVPEPETPPEPDPTPAPQPITTEEPIPVSQPDTPEAPPMAPPPEPVIVEEAPTPEPVIATPIPEPEPPPTLAPELPPVTPAPEPVIMDEPPPIPEPVFTETPVTTPIPAPAPPPVNVPEPAVSPPVAEIPQPEPPHFEPIPVAPTPPPVVIEEPAPIGDPSPVTKKEGGESTPDTEEMATEADVASPTTTDSQKKTDGI